MTSTLARKFRLDVGTYTVSAAGPDVWTQFYGINDFNAALTGTLADTSDSESPWAGSEKTTLSGKVTVKARRPNVGGVYDPGQEIVRSARLGFGDLSRVFVRWYDRGGGPEAYTGVALVDWAQSKTGVSDVEEVQVVFSLDGTITTIGNPAAPAVVLTAESGDLLTV